MKILMLNTFDEWGGAAKAAFRLNEGVRALGFDSRLLVQFDSGNAAEIVGPRSPLARGMNGLRAALDALPVRFSRERPIYSFTPAFVPNRLAARVARENPDLVHLHWMAAGFLRLEALRHFNKPLVWTLHDSWAFTGGCHVPFDCLGYRRRCGQCPVLGSARDGDLSRWIWRRKERAWRDLQLTVVAPSRWLADCARTSSLFRNVRVEVIPNGLDLTRFTPVDRRLARERLNLPQEKRLILFGAVGSTSDRNKGFHLLLPALQKVAASGGKDAAELIVFGGEEPSPAPRFGMPARYLGRLRDTASLILLYSAADLFVAPSVQENLPNTVMEAMACGTPCVGFDQGGMADLIEDGGTGCLVRPYDAEALARAITRLLNAESARHGMGERSRRKIEAEFSLERVSQRYAALYHDVLLGGKGEG